MITNNAGNIFDQILAEICDSAARSRETDPTGFGSSFGSPKSASRCRRISSSQASSTSHTVVGHDRFVVRSVLDDGRPRIREVRDVLRLPLGDHAVDPFDVLPQSIRDDDQHLNLASGKQLDQLAVEGRLPGFQVRDSLRHRDQRFVGWTLRRITLLGLRLFQLDIERRVLVDELSQRLSLSDEFEIQRRINPPPPNSTAVSVTTFSLLASSG